MAEDSMSQTESERVDVRHQFFKYDDTIYQLVPVE